MLKYYCIKLKFFHFIDKLKFTIIVIFSKLEENNFYLIELRITTGNKTLSCKSLLLISNSAPTNVINIDIEMV